MRLKTRKRPEDLIQEAVVEWLNLQCPQLLWWHTHQSGYLSPAERMKAKRMGRRAGVPDLTFVISGGRVAFIELKSTKGVEQDSQITFAGMARAAGALYAVCRSLEEVEGTLKGWGVLKERAA